MKSNTGREENLEFRRQNPESQTVKMWCGRPRPHTQYATGEHARFTIPVATENIALEEALSEVGGHNAVPTSSRKSREFAICREPACPKSNPTQISPGGGTQIPSSSQWHRTSIRAPQETPAVRTPN